PMGEFSEPVAGAGDDPRIEIGRIGRQRRRLCNLLRQRLLSAVGAFFLSHLLYSFYFASQMTLSFFWPLPLVLLVLGALLLAIIWTRLEEYRWPICTFIGMTLVMVWLAG
ncbi:lysoplasmalogenase family protein, partial [Klebsiella pneumoniae]|uniref:lysoplasmalogenase family protein n=1 Tax=Klebsiella pneumoniae TaxID=573 RepID=UPI001D18B0E3